MAMKNVHLSTLFWLIVIKSVVVGKASLCIVSSVVIPIGFLRHQDFSHSGFVFLLDFTEWNFATCGHLTLWCCVCNLCVFVHAELGINIPQILKRTRTVLNPFRINPDLHEDADLSGPIMFCMLFGLCQLLAGKVHFGVILGWMTLASLFLYMVFNLLAGKNGSLDLYRCVSLVGYCLIPMVLFSAVSIFLPSRYEGFLLNLKYLLICHLLATGICVKLTSITLNAQQSVKVLSEQQSSMFVREV